MKWFYLVCFEELKDDHATQKSTWKIIDDDTKSCIFSDDILQKCKSENLNS